MTNEHMMALQCLQDFVSMADNEIERIMTGKAPGPSMRDVLGQWIATVREAKELLAKAKSHDRPE